MTIHILINQQQLRHSRGGLPTLTVPISSASKGVGQLSGSEQTPLGVHRIRAKIGTGLPEGAVLVGRRPTGEVYTPALARQFPGRDWILTRILWLCGDERGFNRLGAVDSMARYIYIHGTPDTEPMGVPASHGCIRLRNKDLLVLFERVHAGEEVIISA
ncbi:L,D-transpeptidase family protein [Aestuariirhabdus sp. LZHN29]|uniref:L,D-transpeptidase family protein n=1 Tax=Aestuariirhabdus sp. LZHN29 TaxID=3417462 RepID=UPI003CFAE132